MIQFLKSGDTGELFAVQKYHPYLQIAQFGKDALVEKQLKIVVHGGTAKNKLTDDHKYTFHPDHEEQEASRRALEHAHHVVNSGDYDIVILDEINSALSKQLIPIEDVLKLITNKPEHVELVLTGRGALPELIKAADYVANITRVKHPYDNGILARKGIEY